MALRMSEGEPTLSVAEVERLAALINSGIAALDDPMIRPVQTDDIRAGLHLSRHGAHELSVNVDVGFTVLELCEDRLGKPTTAFDLARLADAVVSHARMARQDDTAEAILWAARKMVRAKIRRDRSDLDVVSVGFAPARLDSLEKPSRRRIMVRVRVLDELLRPYVTMVCGSHRSICSQLALLGRDEGRRRPILERLRAQGAVLEIERAAEYALSVAGITISDFAREISPTLHDWVARTEKDLTHRDCPEHGVVVYLEDGCIWVRANFGRRYRDDLDGLIIGQTLPETIKVALIGRPLRTLVHHPLLYGDAVITEVAGIWGGQTHLRLAEEVRLVLPHEISW